MTTQQLESYITNRHIQVGNYLYRCETPYRAKITSIKIWKKQLNAGNPQFRIGLKHGLYEYGEITSFHELHTTWQSEWERNSLPTNTLPTH